jgi:hypothetical protein
MTPIQASCFMFFWLCVIPALIGIVIMTARGDK